MNRSLLLLVAVGLAACTRRAPEDVPAPTVAEGMLVVGGDSLYYETAGAGPPVVFVHGGFGDRRMWDDAFRALADSFRVVRYDLRGFGRSSMPDTAYSAAGDLVRLLDHLGIGRAHLVGNSMGGSLVLDAALLHPAHVRTLTVVASGPNGLEAPPEAVQRVVAVFEAARRDGLDAAAVLWLDHPMVRLTSRDPRTAPLLRTMVRDNARAFLMPFAHWPGDPLDPPASLVVAGADDTPLMRSAADTTAAGIAGAQQVVLPGADHLPQMTQPAAFNRALRAFLRTH
jgi:3-oxoadipate enol-lactonase